LRDRGLLAEPVDLQEGRDDRRRLFVKTVRDACQLQANALSIKLSDQIEQLDELIATEGDGAAFFEKTHITQGMQDLISPKTSEHRRVRSR
jgi:hypothetical protein